MQAMADSPERIRKLCGMAPGMECVHCLKFIMTKITRPFKVGAMVLALAVSASQSRGQTAAFEGYGSATLGGSRR
jgi:hypothetical protein